MTGKKTSKANKKASKASSSKPRSIELQSRCSAKYFFNILEKLKDDMKTEHHILLGRTPFYNYLYMPQLSTAWGRVQTIAQRFNPEKCAFSVGDNISIPFSSAEFSLILGLNDVGFHVNPAMDVHSAMLDRVFPGKKNEQIHRDMITEKLHEYVKKCSNEDMEDFVRLLIILLFNCLFFSKSNYLTLKYVIPYVDNLNTLGDYAWGRAAHSYLVEQISRYVRGGKKAGYMEGCIIGLMVSIMKY